MDGYMDGLDEKTMNKYALVFFIHTAFAFLLYLSAHELLVHTSYTFIFIIFTSYLPYLSFLRVLWMWPLLLLLFFNSFKRKQPSN